MKLVIAFLRDNWLFLLGNLSFWQITGIRKSSDPAPSIEKMFMNCYEKKWILDTWKIWFFSCTFRFLEHFCAINDYLEFDRNFKNKYHRELWVKKENTSTSVASFSDISLKIEKKKIKTRLYDKRDAFSPSIVCMPHLDSNILSNVYYAYKVCQNYFGYGYLCNTF